MPKGAFAGVSGVEYRGVVPHGELPRHLADADALIMPYKTNAFTKGTFPAKTYECLATGKPTVATPLPDLARFGDLLYLAEDAGGFIETLRRLPETESAERVRARMELASRNSWEARFGTVEEIIQEGLRGG
jgi:glycosyltransferase involved in cell wall biosynthesis